VAATFRTLKECYDERFPFIHGTERLRILIKPPLCAKAAQAFFPLYNPRSIHCILVNISLIAADGNNTVPKSIAMNAYFGSTKAERVGTKIVIIPVLFCGFALTY
jgi:hypothetical protein